MKNLRNYNKMPLIVGMAALVMGIMSSLSLSATVTGGETPNLYGGGCYNPITLECSSYGTLGGGQQLVCNFTGVYGPPYNCTDVPCFGGTRTDRHCVDGNQ